jgi:hypothetical protein
MEMAIAEAKNTAKHADDEQIDSRLPLWLAIFANAASLLLTLQFFWLSPTDWVRPMGYEVWVIATELNAVIVLPLVLFNLKRLRGRTWPRYAVALSLTPIPLALVVERLARAIIGYHLSQ